MGGSKQKTTSNQQQSQTVELPEWMTQAGQELYSQAAASAAANPVQAYTGQMRAGASANQTAASAAAAASMGAGQSDLNAARMMTAQAAYAPQQQVRAPEQQATGMQAAQQGVASAGAAPMARAAHQGVASAGAAPMAQAAQQGVASYDAAQQGRTGQVQADQVTASQFDAAAAARYANPYLAQVQQNTLGEMRRQNQIDRAMLNDSVQGSSAFGGTRGALLESEQARNQNTAAQQFVASSNADAYTAAQAAFESDRAASMAAATGNADRSLSAGTTNATLFDQMLARNMAATNDASQFNAGARNAAAGANADRQQQTGLANQSLLGTFALADQSARNAAAGANADREQQVGLANQNQQGSFQLADQSAANTAMGANAARAQGANEFNASAANTAAGANADRSLAASTTNAANEQSMLNRMMEAAKTFGNIGTTSSDLNTQQIANLANTGLVDQATTDDQMQAAYQEFLRMQNAPNEQYQNLMAILSGTPRNITTNGTSSGTSTSKTSGGFMNTALGLGQLGLSAKSAGVFSDRRLKRDITRFDTLPNGLGVYRYGYVWDAPDESPRIGVMADEVARLAPHALGPTIAGFMTVDYSKIGGLL